MSAFPPTAVRLFGEYQDHLYLRFAPSTIPGYRSFVEALLLWLAEKGIQTAEVRTADLLAYQSHLLALRKADGRPFSVGHHTNHLKAVKGFFRFLLDRGFLLHDPAAALPYPRSEHRLPRSILTVAEARKLVEAPDLESPLGLRDRAIFELFYATGIRAGELAQLTPYDVDTEDRLVRIVLGKGRRDRNVPLTKKAALAIEAYLQSGRPRLTPGRRLFVGSRGGPLSRGMLSMVVRRWAKKVRIKKRVTCHTFRHSVATHLLRGKADIRHIQALLGHASLSTTELYTRVEVADLQEVLRRAHPRGR